MLSIQRAERYGVCLYFLGYGGASDTEQQPYADPADPSSSNREWLWRAPFGQIELQHWENFELETELLHPESENEEVGFVSVTLSVPSVARAIEGALAHGGAAPSATAVHGDSTEAIVTAPEGITVRLVRSEQATL